MSLYDALLHLYPKSFRLEYGDEMRAIFRERATAADGAGALLVLWFEAFRDVIPNALLAHLDILGQDLAFTLRSLSRMPGFTVTAILVAALGIGATTAAFSVTDRVLIRDLPFRDADRLVKIYQAEPGYSRFEPSPAHYRDWKGMNASFEDLGAYAVTSMNLLSDGEPLRVTGAAGTANLLPTIGAVPLLGRLFSPEEDTDGTAGTVVLSYGLWQEVFGGRAAAVGSRIRLDEESHVVIGVMPREFTFPDRTTRLWTTIRFSPGLFEDRDNHYLHVIGRLRNGVTLASARADMAGISSRLKQMYPKENDVTLALLSDQVPGQARLILQALFGAALCVLLIACTNLAGLLIARSLQRRKELAVRTAIGAGRERLIRQLMTESVTLALCGGALGVVLAVAVTPVLGQLAPANLPMSQTAGIDGRILLFAAIMTLATGLGFGVVPALSLNRDRCLDGLREGPRGGVGGRGRLRSALVFSEVAICVVLLVSCGLLVRALWRVQQTDPGFRPEGLLTARTSLPMNRYAPTAARGLFYDRVLTEVKALPGVRNAAYTSFLPMVMRGGIWNVRIPGRPETRVEDKVSIRFVTPGYFDTMGVPLLRGRDFGPFDTRSAPPVIVVSQSFAELYWPNQDPIGRVVNVAFEDRVIVGLAAEVKTRGLERISEPQVYLGHLQIADGSVPFYAPKDIAVRVSADPAAIGPAVREVIRRADPMVPVSDVRTMIAIVQAETSTRSVQLAILQAFALIAVVLAGVGLHGLIAFSVANRLPEIGVRVVLGATPRHILDLVLRDGLRLTTLGVAAGLAGAYAAGRGMEALLAGVSPADLPSLAVAGFIALAMALAGSLLPALRAVRVKPTIVMRAE